MPPRTTVPAPDAAPALPSTPAPPRRLDGFRIFGGPLRYLQGPGALDTVGEEARLCGRRALLVADAVVQGLVAPRVEAACAAAGVEYASALFGGEVTPAERDRLVGELARGSSHGARPDVVIAAGGGKGIDMGKAVARAIGAQVITLPTAASNDAPTSKIFVLYDEAHRLLSVEHLDRNPAAVIVDTALIARAPLHLLLAGIGDALSKKSEVARCAAAGGTNIFGGRGTATASALADFTEQQLRRHAEPAIAALRRGESDPHVEALVEATVLLSGLCFENGGLSIAHALTRGLSALPGVASALHGLQVAYGLLVQWVLEQRSAAEMDDLLDFYRRIDLPRSLRDLGLPQAPTLAQLQAVAQPSVAAPHTRNFPRLLAVDDLVQAMAEVERLAAA